MWECAIFTVSMSPKVARKSREVSDFRQQMPELEKEIRRISNDIMAARIRHENDKAKGLELELNELLKRKKEIMASRPVRREAEIGLPIPGRVNLNF